MKLVVLVVAVLALAPAARAATPRVSIFDIHVDESVGNATFNVKLSAPSDQTVTVDAATTDIVAKAPDDYAATSTTLTFPPGQTAAQVTVPIVDDQLDENDEVFDVVLANPTNATLGRVRGRATIVDDDPEPSVSVADASTSAVLNGAGVRFTITLSPASGRAVSVAVSTADGTARAGSDYVATATRVAFRPGETIATVDVPVVQDSLDEPDETFLVHLANPLNATIADGEAVGSIPDDDPPPTVVAAGVTVVEGNAGTTAATFTVALSKASGKTITVGYATQDGTAKAPDDYRPLPRGTLTFRPGEVTKTLRVLVVGDRTVEADETFFLVLSDPVNTLVVGAPGRVTIRNDDAVAPPKAGVSANLRPAAGVVLVKVAGGRFVPLGAIASIPFGAVVDTRRGRVSVVSAEGRADFFGGLFVLRSEPAGRGRVTTLALAGGSFAGCPKPRPRARKPAAVAAPPSRVVRLLWGDGKGGFRIRGRYAAATIRGTRWRVEDRCDGTRILVLRGRVSVLDPKHGRTVVVTAGQSLLIRP